MNADPATASGEEGITTLIEALETLLEFPAER